jgi:hypothetical protein
MWRDTSVQKQIRQGEAPHLKPTAVSEIQVGWTVDLLHIT